MFVKLIFRESVICCDDLDILMEIVVKDCVEKVMRVINK